MDVLERICRARVVPVVRQPSAAQATALCERLLALGTPVIELTATTPNWPEVLNRLWRMELRHETRCLLPLGFATTLPGGRPGLYLIRLDGDGERTFYDYRAGNRCSPRSSIPCSRCTRLSSGQSCKFSVRPHRDQPTTNA